MSRLRLHPGRPRRRPATLRGGGAWASRTFSLQPDGHGRLAALGQVTVESRPGTVTGAADEVSW
jgi:hypothetical protein